MKGFGCRPYEGWSRAHGAGVRKPPGEETAGMDTGERAAYFELSRPQMRTQRRRDGTNIAKWGFDVLRRLRLQEVRRGKNKEVRRGKNR